MEPDQKRLRRIGDYIEDEIARAEHFPIEELSRHKTAMVRVLQFLNIEEAYGVSLLSRRIYEWFQRNNIWFALAQRWLSPARLAQCEAWVDQVNPKGKRVNYLWLLLWDFTAKPLYSKRVKIVSRVDGTQLARIDAIYPWPLLWVNDITGDLFEVTEKNGIRYFYEFMLKYPDARVQFSSTGALIRSKLN